jgi:two-component system copper resistance phosphate regulon response regulator CusR
MMNRILVVEDEPAIASFLRKGLTSSGFTTSVVADGRDALEAVRSGQFDLVILDLGLPKLDGLSVLRALRERDRRTPVIILTAREGVADMVEGLDAGADDYITKPFRLEVLLARIRARFRGEGREEDEHMVRARNITLDLRTRRAFVGEVLVELTPREFAVAETFFRHPDQVLSREQILSAVWGYFHDPGSNLVDVYVRYLRKKLRDDLIETVRGLGYRLVP